MNSSILYKSLYIYLKYITCEEASTPIKSCINSIGMVTDIAAEIAVDRDVVEVGITKDTTTLMLFFVQTSVIPTTDSHK